MKITIPLYIRSADDRYYVKPLFFSGPLQESHRLERALEHLRRDLRRTLEELGQSPLHDQLAAWGFAPEAEYKRLPVAIELRRRVVRVKLGLVVFPALERRIGFAPDLPDVWFEITSGDKLEDRAGEALSEYFRKREQEDEDDFQSPEYLDARGQAWIMPLELEIEFAQKLGDLGDVNLLFLGGPQEVDGRQELFRIARCLDDLFPDDLDRAWLREREVEELTRLLQTRDHRPVLLLGPAQVGKTTVLHEYVYRTVEQRKERHSLDNRVWLVSPMRLISGMSAVGQWENRLLAILKELKSRDSILYTDDFLGYYTAGQHSRSDLSAAHVLKPFIERREVRLLVEMTPEAYRVLRERDRGFADLFHILPLGEPTELELMRQLVRQQRELEARHAPRFGVDVLPQVVNLQRRYARHLSFPGKAALFLQRLAVKYKGQDVSPYTVLREFSIQTGLSLSFLDDRAKLERQQVIEALEKEVQGQPAALEALADVVCTARARLNDPDRPLGTLLFLGPTGVGKTQAAKALAKYLFGDAERLLRFDMNEYVDPGAGARLIGTFHQPDGLLTSAIRRQPFAVLLFDEIEKADPDVFDLLLQVLGEGRLTDAHGRLADFSNVIIILTSNLGVREATGTLGFRRDEAVEAAIFTQAAEKFFRPEFFNRLDRIVPFRRLDRQDMVRIARLVLAELMQREGLVRRRCILDVSGPAEEHLVDLGFDPQLGARALKRGIERELTRPLAERLAGGLPTTLTVIRVQRVQHALAVDVQELVEAPPPTTRIAFDLNDRRELLERLKKVAVRLERELEPFRPPGAISAADVEGRYYEYFSLRDLLRTVRRECAVVEEQLAARPRLRGPSLPLEPVRPVGLVHSDNPKSDPQYRVLKEMAQADDVVQFLKELSGVTAAAPVRGAGDLRRELMDIVVAHNLVAALHNGEPERVLIWCAACGAADPEEAIASVNTFGPYTSLPGNAFHGLGHFGSGEWSWGTDAEEERRLLEYTDLGQTQQPAGQAFLLHGTGALTLLQQEAGTNLMCDRNGALSLVGVHVWPVPDGVELQSLLEAKLTEWRLWHVRLQAGTAALRDDPLALGPVVWIQRPQRGSGPWFGPGLPLPPELLE